MSPLQSDLEILTGKLVTGDMTFLVYELVKDSPYKSDLIKGVSKKKEKLNEKKVEGIEHAKSFDSWLKTFM